MVRNRFFSVLTIAAALTLALPANAQDTAAAGATVSAKSGVTLTEAGKANSDAARIDPSKERADYLKNNVPATPAPAAGASQLDSLILDSLGKIDLDTPLPQTPATPADIETPATENPLSAPPTAPNDSRRFLFASRPKDFSEKSYAASVTNLFAAFETKTARALKPGASGKVGLKIYTASGNGLATPKNLTRAVIKELEKRGFARDKIFLLDLNEKFLRTTGYLPRLPVAGETFEGCPVLALDSGKHYNGKWSYANPLPSKEVVAAPGDYSLAISNADKLSMLPVPLMFDVDFWISLPVATDSQALGVSGALGNATIWNISNQKRFLENAANAQKAAVEIAAIPELHEKFVFTLLSLEKYQFIGGPEFDSNYCLSENRLWLSGNPLILDFLMMERMNKARVRQNLPAIDPEPAMFLMGNAAPIYLGSCVPSEITLVQVDSAAGK